MNRWSSRTVNWRLAVAVSALAIGIALRVLGLNWGLPHQLNSDEWVIVTGALDLAQRNSFEPSLYFRPDHVEIQLSFIAYQAYAHLIAHAPVDVAYAADPGVFLLLSRAVTAVFGVASIVLAYFIGGRFNRTIAVIAAVLFSLFPLFVEHSHFVSPDVPLTAALLAVILALMHYLERPRYATLLMACAATSIAIAIKYPGAIATIVIAVVVVFAALRDRRYARVLTHGATAITAVVFFLFVISPVLFTNFQAVTASIRQESRTEHPGADGLGWGGNLGYYAGEFVEVSGILLTIMVLVGVLAVVRHRLVLALPVLLGLVFWVLLSAVPLHWERWGVPMFISPLILGSIGSYYSYVFLAERFLAHRWLKPAAAAFAVIVVANLLLGSLGLVAAFLASDTRLTAAARLDDRGITESNTIYEGYSPFIPGTPRNIFDEFTTVNGRLVPVHPDRTFVLTSSCMNDRYFQQSKFSDERRFYAAVDSQFALELRITPEVSARHSAAFEPLNMLRGAQVVQAFLAGGSSGCTLSVYRIAP